MNIIQTLCRELGTDLKKTEATVALLDEGNTIPFIARYRKEVTGSMDDQLLRQLDERLQYLRSLEEQREKVRAAVEAQGLLTDELNAALDAATTLAEIEDWYRPYRPKRKTRASVAKANGLQPLAEQLLAQDAAADPQQLAQPFVTEAVPSVQDALQGAMDIIAEQVSDDAALRGRLRNALMSGAVLSTAPATEDLGVYEQYRTFSQPVSRLPGHRILAINRGEKEEKLKVSLEYDAERAIAHICQSYVKNGGACADAVRAACADAYTRLLFPSLERELRNTLTDTACTAAIGVFADNLRPLLMQPPLRAQVVLGLDPGYRNGCKTAVVDATGRVLATGVVYPVPPFNKIEQAKALLSDWIRKYGVTAVAIGNGTASHETEVFAADLLQQFPQVSYMVVNEAGASVYSASPVGAKEFPQYDVSVRSAISIARRLQDPLAELVKIDPQSIGVGQYQHDMPQAQLGAALDGVVEQCVNNVGADLNTASAPLLARVAGINATVAANIVAYREENGAFTSRAQLKKVPKLGPKAFVQCAGFLRIPDAREPLDRTAVHPESYDAARALLSKCCLTAQQLANGELGRWLDVQDTAKLAADLGIGEPTLRDIAAELQKPGRDPRDELPPPMLRREILDISSLRAGMQLSGTVRNVVDFGAFVDIGVHQDGLVHLSQMSNKFIRHPSEVLRVGDVVQVTVLDVDVKRKRIALTMKGQPSPS